MEFFKFVGWFLLSIAVPLLGPIALLPLLATSREFKPKAKELMKWSVQDGQLYWPIIATCAAAWYEVAGVLSQQGAEEARNYRAIIAWTSIGWHVLVIVMSSVLVSLCTIDTAHRTAHQAFDAPEIERQLSPAVLISVYLSAAVAVTFSLTHYWIN